ncbi:hypothetical protein KAT24_00485 [Candidatus Pacearchaeota archaeon]|nr:hypothetical protein [Candidatus Pacearchaeota archaeon]
MQKRVLVLVMFLIIMLAGFVSAASFSLSDALGSIQEGTLVVLLVFIISFALLFFALNRAFKNNVPIAAVISFASAFGITYWVNKSGFDLSGWVYDIGISSEILSILIPILVLALAIFLIAKLRRDSLFVFGGFLLASSFFVYEKTVVIVFGIILILVRLFMGKGRWKRGRYPWQRPFSSWRDRPYSRPRPFSSWGDSPYFNPRKGRYKKGKGNVGRWEKAKRGRIRERDLARLRELQEDRIRRDKEGKQAEKERKFEERERREYEEARQEDKIRREKERKFEEREKKRAEKERRQEREEVEEERKYEKRERKQIGEEKKYKKIERKQERIQITANLQSLIRTYNEIQRTDPSDPRLKDLVKEIKRVRKNK